MDGYRSGVALVLVAGMLAMALYFARKNTNTEEYFVGGRSFSGWVIGISMVGTVISSITFLAYPGDAYKTSWIRFLPNFMLPLGAVIAASEILDRDEALRKQLVEMLRRLA